MNFTVTESQLTELFRSAQQLNRIANVLSGPRRNTNVLFDHSWAVSSFVVNTIFGEEESDRKDDFNDLCTDLVNDDTPPGEAVQILISSMKAVKGVESSCRS